MKNLKKVLALVLVVATLFGLSAMASATTSEDYSDAANITHYEAVDVMSTIGVFDGISGAFSGDSILTREQAAKIITYMILGKDEADKLVASVAPYTDVARDRWSAGSIAYCKNQGILAGVGNGRFEPNGKLTGVAFAKMCLVALGYDPTIEVLTGSQWAVNTSKLAISEAGITANLSQPSLADDMTREDACQMAFNTIQADMVDYANRGGNITVNGANISMSATKAQPVSVDTGWTDTYRRDGNIYAEAFEQGQDGIQQFAEKYFVDLAKSETKQDAFGRPSIVWTYKADEIGTYKRTDWLVKSWTAKAPKSEMYEAIGSSVYDKLGLREYDGFIDTENTHYYYNDRALTVRVDGERLNQYYDEGYDADLKKDIRTATKTFKEFFFAKNSSKEAGTTVYPAGNQQSSNIGKTGNGVLTEVYKNNKGDVWVAIINTYLVRATADFNSSLNRVNIEAMPIDDNNNVPLNWLPTYISGDDFDVTGIKEGDYLLITVSVPEGKVGNKTSSNHEGPNGDTTIQSVTPATLQTAAVTEYTERDSVTMGGTKYSYNKILGDDEKSETFSINSDATLVLDTYGYIMYVTDALSSSNFVYIDNYAEGTHLRRSFIADAYFADGTNSEITVGKIDGTKIGSSIAHEIDKYRARRLWNEDATQQGAEQIGERLYGNQRFSHWYTFTGSSGSEYTLRTPSRNRYDEPQSALTVDFTALDVNKPTDSVVLIKNNTVRFMAGVAGNSTVSNYMNMYELAYDAKVDSTGKVDSNGTSKADCYGGVSISKVEKAINDKKQPTCGWPKPIDTASKLYDEINGVRGNANTIFVVKGTDGDVDTYTGIANVPTITLGVGHKGGAKVSWINRRDSEYASYVFIDVSGKDMHANVKDDTSAADYMFTLKATNDRTYVDGLDYLKYTVWIDGKEEERWLSTRLFDNNGLSTDAREGRLFKNVKEDSHGRITNGKLVNSNNTNQDNRFIDWIYEADGIRIDDDFVNMKSTISQKGNALSILTMNKIVPNASYAVSEDVGLPAYWNGTVYVNDLFANSSSNINLVVADNNSDSNVDVLLKDKGLDYEVHPNVSARYVAGMLENYRIQAEIFLVVDEDDPDVIDTLWIYLTDVRARYER